MQCIKRNHLVIAGILLWFINIFKKMYNFLINNSIYYDEIGQLKACNFSKLLSSFYFTNPIFPTMNFEIFPWMCKE